MPIGKLDPERAKKLLTEAGYPNGFSIDAGRPNGRYINDVKVAQAVAAMWTRIGVKTKVDANAPPVFFKNRDSLQVQRLHGRLGHDHRRDVSNALLSLLVTPNKAKGMGTTNSCALLQPGHGRKLVIEAMAHRSTTPSVRRCCAKASEIAIGTTTRCCRSTSSSRSGPCARASPTRAAPTRDDGAMTPHPAK